ncbi:hypothetical protein C9J03_11475 [Photobacterium gaetbulicola]|uniref:ABC transporter permease subunit n=1 Tax=Photobacterium gaetbulicola TaxID=1295392 RepID=UPI0005CC383C|nr:ABC transporter permease subunit [Photobacterium gaetbulicola]PSU11752.1 hypothetical protein C9J03_11475 [Photobacterium gaetbulicola]
MSYAFRWDLVLSPFWLDSLLMGFYYTAGLFIFSSMLSLMLGGAFAFAELSNYILISKISKVICHLLKNTPAPFLMLACYILFPVLFPAEIRDIINGYQHFGFYSAVAGLTLNCAPYMNDVIKSGYGAIPRGVYDVARVSGFKKYQIAWLIVVPGLLISIFPAMNLRLVHNFKNTSLAMLISVPELTWQSQEIESITFASIEVTTVVTVIYIVSSLVISRTIITLEHVLFSYLRWPRFDLLGG